MSKNLHRVVIDLSPEEYKIASDRAQLERRSVRAEIGLLVSRALVSPSIVPASTADDDDYHPTAEDYEAA